MNRSCLVGNNRFCILEFIFFKLSLPKKNSEKNYDSDLETKKKRFIAKLNTNANFVHSI